MIYAKRIVPGINRFYRGHIQNTPNRKTFSAMLIISYKQVVSVNVGNELSSPGKLSCGANQGSILRPLLLLLYVNITPQAVRSELLFYADDTCLICTGRDIKTIEDQLNKDFNSLCKIRLWEVKKICLLFRLR